MFKRFSKQSPRRETGAASTSHHDQSMQTEGACLSEDDIDIQVPDENTDSYTTANVESTSISSLPPKALAHQYDKNLARLKKEQALALVNEEELATLLQANARVETQIAALKKYRADLKSDIDVHLQNQGKEQFRKFKVSAPHLFTAFKNSTNQEDYLAFIKSASEHIEMVQLFAKITYNNYVAASSQHDTQLARKVKRIKAIEDASSASGKNKKLKKPGRRRGDGCESGSTSVPVSTTATSGTTAVARVGPNSHMVMNATGTTTTGTTATSTTAVSGVNARVMVAMMQGRIEQQFLS